VSNRFYAGLVVCGLVLALTASGATQHLDRSPSQDWRTYGGNFGQQRFSRLRHVTTQNVDRLRIAWTFAIPDAGIIDNSLQTTPLVVRGKEAGLPAFDAVMLVTTPRSGVLALDATNGRQLWAFRPPLRNPLNLCCSSANRGAAFGRVSQGPRGQVPRVYVATLDARVWALSASTGRPVSTFGDGVGPAGSVTVGENRDGYSLTMAPLFISRADIPSGGLTRRRDLVVVGIAGGEFANRGFVTAYDASTGERVWRFFTTAAPDEFGGDTWPTTQTGPFADAHLRGGGPVWMTPTYDPNTGRLFVAVGNAAPVLDGTHRAGDNLFTDSVVSLDVRTGKRVWHFQEVHHDLWDYDPASPPVLIDVLGTAAVAQAGKTGFLYILDRRNGEPLFPCPETPVPPSRVIAPDGSAELTSPTQPVCGEGLTFVPLLRPGSATSGGIQPLFTPPSPTGTSLAPGLFGGSEWSPVAYHPALGLAFVSGVTPATTYFAFPEAEPAPGRLSLGGLPIPHLLVPGGTLTGIDVNAGNIRWQHKTPWPLVGGALATAGGLLFYGEGSPFGGAFVAVEASSGIERFRSPTVGGVNAAPITYLAGGRQLVTVAAGGHLHYLSRLDNLLVTFGLEGE
jgi:quinohemoprotein ethanol dehydrogenase